MKMGTELVSETSADLHISSRRSTLENFIEFCPCESFQTFKIIIVRNSISRCYILCLLCYIFVYTVQRYKYFFYPLQHNEYLISGSPGGGWVGSV